MRFTVVGSSPAWPNPGSAHAGYLISGEGGRLLVDCGPGVLSRLRADAEGGWPQLDAIAVTHCHLDHVGDLVPWLWGRLMGPARDRAATPLWLPAGGRTALAELTGGAPLDDVFAVHEYADRQRFEAAGLSIRPLAVPHFGIPAFGLVVTDGEATVALSGDSGPSPVLAELAEGADLFVCEATVPDTVAPAPGRGHLSAAEALAAGAGARRVLLTHRPVELGVPEGAEVAVDGFTLEL